MKKELEPVDMRWHWKECKKTREEKGFSQKALSLDIGQESTSIISQAELAGRKHFNIEQLYKVATILEVDICEFFKKWFK